MFRRKRAAREVAPDLRDAFEGFRRVVDTVEEAKNGLSAAAPGGRSAGIPLAEALAAFEQGLRDASASMPAWRRPEVAEVWTACQEGLQEAGGRAECLRLGDAPDGYEQLYGELGDLMEPLDSFIRAVERFRELGL